MPHPEHPANADTTLARAARLVDVERRPARKPVRLRLRRHDVVLRPVGDEMFRLHIDGHAGPVFLNRERARSAAIEEVYRLDRAARAGRRSKESDHVI